MSSEWNFYGQNSFSWTFRVKFTFSDRIRNIKLNWIFEFLHLSQKGHGGIYLGVYTEQVLLHVWKVPGH